MILPSLISGFFFNFGFSFIFRFSLGCIGSVNLYRIILRTNIFEWDYLSQVGWVVKVFKTSWNFFMTTVVVGLNRFRPKICCRSVIDFQLFFRRFLNFFLYNHEVLKAVSFKLFFQVIFSTSFSEFLHLKYCEARLRLCVICFPVSFSTR